MSITKKIDEVTEIPEAYKNTILPAPPSVKIELTSHCNFRCSFCAHQLQGKTFGEMDQSFYKKIVQDMFDSGVRELGLFYIGESLLCSWLPEAIRYAKAVGFPYIFLSLIHI